MLYYEIRRYWSADGDDAGETIFCVDDLDLAREHLGDIKDSARGVEDVKRFSDEIDIAHDVNGALLVLMTRTD